MSNNFRVLFIIIFNNTKIYIYFFLLQREDYIPPRGQLYKFRANEPTFVSTIQIFDFLSVIVSVTSLGSSLPAEVCWIMRFLDPRLLRKRRYYLEEEREATRASVEQRNRRVDQESISLLLTEERGTAVLEDSPGSRKLTFRFEFLSLDKFRVWYGCREARLFAQFDRMIL